MRSRLAPVLVLLLVVTACAPAPAPEPEAESAATPMDDAAAVDAVRAAYVEHYNLGHADMVADLFADDGVSLLADGSVNFGREAIQAALEATLAEGPTVSIENADTMVMGDRAVARGSYTIEMAAEGAEAVSFGGHFITGFQRVDGEWKISVVASNYSAPPTEGMPSVPAPTETMDDMTHSPTAELMASYAEHFNMGHPSVVAGMYDEDAVAAFPDGPLAEGSVAIEAALENRLAAGSPQLTIHEIGNDSLGDGWYLGGGWYEITATTDDGETRQIGNWLAVVSTAQDGTQRIHWAITNVMNDGM